MSLVIPGHFQKLVFGLKTAQLQKDGNIVSTVLTYTPIFFGNCKSGDIFGNQRIIILLFPHYI